MDQELSICRHDRVLHQRRCKLDICIWDNEIQLFANTYTNQYNSDDIFEINYMFVILYAP